MPGGNQHMHAGMMFLDPAHKHQPVHEPGHLYIGEDHVHSLPGYKHRDRFCRVGGLDDCIASVPQIVGYCVSGQDLVFNDQKGPFPGRFTFVVRVLLVSHRC